MAETIRETAERLAGPHGDLCRARSRPARGPIQIGGSGQFNAPLPGGRCTCEVAERVQAIKEALRARDEAAEERAEAAEAALEEATRGRCDDCQDCREHRAKWEAEGWRKGRDAAAHWVSKQWSMHSCYTAEELARAIRSLLPPTEEK